MEGLGPGSVLGGRYTISRRVLAGHGAERWEARDEHLQRDVTVLAFPTSHLQRDAAFDAARRAAGVRDSRLAAVLDVGVDGPVAYVIEEGLPSSRNYATLAVTGGLPAEEVRRIVGEAAVGLDAASRRGLHHGALSPEAVLVTEDGDVKLLGLATTAALADHDDEDSGVARRIDAIGLVGLTYAGLTGRWPLAGDSGGLPPAPRIVGGVAAPSEIAVGVPADLDAICRLTLNDDAGPESPGDLAGQIAPWSPTPIQLDAGRWTKDYAPRPVPAAPPNADAPAPQTRGGAEGAGTRDAAKASGTAAAGAAPAGTGTAPSAADEASADADEAPGAAAPAATAGSSAAWAAGVRSAWARNDRVFDVESDATVPRSGLEAAPRGSEPGAARTQPLSAAAATGPDRSGDADGPPTGTAGSTSSTSTAPTSADEPDTTDTTDDGERTGSVTAAGAALSAALAKGATSTTSAVSAIGDRLSGLVRSSADRAADLTAERRAVRDARDQWTRQHRVALGSTLERGEEAVEPPAPLLHPDTAEPLSRAESRAALLIVVGFVAIALAIGLWGVSRIGNGSDLGLGAEPRQTTISTPAPTRRTTPAPTTAGGLEPLAIASASAYDPQGDNAENNDQVPRVYDGNPDTYWQSEGYQSQNFGGLKNGVGVILDIGANATAKQIVVTVPTTASFQVWVNSDKSLDKATLVGESSGQSGQLKLDVPATAKGQYIVVWFTKPAEMGGRYRAALSEVQVLG